MSTKPSVAVIGAGYFGRFHARHYGSHPGCTLAAIVDVDRERAASVAGEFGGRPVTSIEALPESVVAASVACPTRHHRAIAGALMERGIHVLVEKPIAASLDEADALAEIAARTGRVLQVGHIERFSAAYGALRTAVRGIPRFMAARRHTEAKGRATDVDVVLDLMIHDIDLALDLADAPVLSVDAAGAACLNDTLDACQARIVFANGVVADLSASRIAETGERSFRVFDEDGYVLADLAGHELVEARRGDTGDAPWRIDRRTVERVDGLRAEIDAFLAAVDGRANAPVTGKAGRDAVAVALSIGAAARRRQPTIHLDRSA